MCGLAADWNCASQHSVETCRSIHSYVSPGRQVDCHNKGNCWESAYATGVGFWPVGGCSALQPLPELWEQEPFQAKTPVLWKKLSRRLNSLAARGVIKSLLRGCINTVMANRKKTAAIAVSKGYKYLSTPLLAAPWTSCKIRSCLDSFATRGLLTPSRQKEDRIGRRFV